MNSQTFFLLFAVFLCGVSSAGVAGDSTPPVQWRLATSYKPNSEGHLDVVKFTEKVMTRSKGRISIRIYPADQLGDWIEVYEQIMMDGPVHMTFDAVPATIDSRLVIASFPYAVIDYATAAQAFAPGGYMYEIVDEITSTQGVKVLSSWAHGFGGGAFAERVPNPTDPDTAKNMKVRVWPGGTPHRALMERLGFVVTMVPWAEVYTAVQTGVVDGVIGGNPELTLNHFKDITKMYIQYNDHFGVRFFSMNKKLWDSLSPEDKNIVQGSAVEVMNDRLLEAENSDLVHLQLLRDAGVEVVVLNDATLQRFAKITRQDVWPKVKDEIGEELFEKLLKSIDGTETTAALRK